MFGIGAPELLVVVILILLVIWSILKTGSHLNYQLFPCKEDALKKLRCRREPGRIFTLLRRNSTFVAEAATSAEQVAPS